MPVTISSLSESCADLPKNVQGAGSAAIRRSHVSSDGRTVTGREEREPREQDASSTACNSRRRSRWRHWPRDKAPAEPAPQAWPLSPGSEVQRGQAASRAQDRPVPPARRHDRSSGPGPGHRRHVPPHAARIPVSAGDSGPDDGQGVHLGPVDHADQRLLRHRAEFTGVLRNQKILVRIDGRGHCDDNVFVERLSWII